MFGGLLVGTGDWYSTRCKLTWKLKVTPSSRVYFQLAVSTLPIDENEFGLLPAATPSDFKTRGPNSKQQDLPEAARAGLLPTPTCGDVTTRMNKSVSDGAAVRPNLCLMGKIGLLPTPNASEYRSGMANRVGQKHNQSLNDRVVFQIQNGMLPTPQASDWKGSGGASENWKGKSDLAVRAHDLSQVPNGKTSQLNPRFVGEMMGFPVNWTELPFLSGEAKASKPTEMPSYLL